MAGLREARAAEEVGAPRGGARRGEAPSPRRRAADPSCGSAARATRTRSLLRVGTADLPSNIRVELATRRRRRAARARRSGELEDEGDTDRDPRHRAARRQRPRAGGHSRRRGGPRPLAGGAGGDAPQPAPRWRSRRRSRATAATGTGSSGCRTRGPATSSKAPRGRASCSRTSPRTAGVPSSWSTATCGLEPGLLSAAVAAGGGVIWLGAGRPRAARLVHVGRRARPVRRAAEAHRRARRNASGRRHRRGDRARLPPRSSPACWRPCATPARPSWRGAIPAAVSLLDLLGLPEPSAGGGRGPLERASRAAARADRPCGRRPVRGRRRRGPKACGWCSRACRAPARASCCRR